MDDRMEKLQKIEVEIQEVEKKEAELKRLKTEIDQSVDELLNIIGEILTEYLRFKENKTGNPQSSELHYFFMKELEILCEQNTFSYFEFILSLPFNEEKGNLTPRALKLQEYLNTAYNKAVERVKKGETIGEEIKIIADTKERMCKTAQQPKQTSKRHSRKKNTNSNTSLTLLSNSFYPLYYGSMTSNVIKYNSRKLEIDKFNDTATSLQSDGMIKVINYSELNGDINVRAKKLLDLAVLKLSHSLYYSGGDTTDTVDISVEEYADLFGMDISTERRRERVMDNMHIDLKNLKHVEWTSVKGQKRDKNYLDTAIISGHTCTKGKFNIYFAQLAVKYLANHYVMFSFPTNLFKVSNKHPNTYLIGRKIVQHNNIDNNIVKGTDSTLSLTSLIEASELPTFPELREKGQRNWKRLIKDKFEKSMQELIENAVLTSWKYRNTDGKIFTPDEVSKLSADEYSGLLVDFCVFYSDDETKRRTNRIEQKQEQKEQNERAKQNEKI